MDAKRSREDADPTPQLDAAKDLESRRLTRRTSVPQWYPLTPRTRDRRAEGRRRTNRIAPRGAVLRHSPVVPRSTRVLSPVKSPRRYPLRPYLTVLTVMKSWYFGERRGTLNAHRLQVAAI